MSAEPEFRVDRLDELMGIRGLGPGELAYLSGVSYNMIYLLRQGKRPNVSAVVVAKLARALKVDIEELVSVPSIGTALATAGNERVFFEVESPEEGQLVRELFHTLEDLPLVYQSLLVDIAQAVGTLARRRNVWTQEEILNLVERVFGEDALNELLDELGAAPDPGDRSDQEEPLEDKDE